MGPRIRTLAIRPGVAAEARRVRAVGPRIVTLGIAQAAGAVPRAVAVADQIRIRVIGRGKGEQAAAIQAFLMPIPVMGQAMAGAARSSARLIPATKIQAVFAADPFGGG